MNDHTMSKIREFFAKSEYDDKENVSPKERVPALAARLALPIVTMTAFAGLYGGLNGGSERKDPEGEVRITDNAAMAMATFPDDIGKSISEAVGHEYVGVLVAKSGKAMVFKDAKTGTHYTVGLGSRAHNLDVYYVATVRYLQKKLLRLVLKGEVKNA